MRRLAASAALASVLVAPAAAIGADDATILHLLRRLTYGPRPGDVERVRAAGVSEWVERQLAPSTLDDGAVELMLRELPTLGMSIPELLVAYPRPDREMLQKVQSGEMTRRELMARYPLEKRPARIAEELAAARAVRAVASERQLQEVMVDFWLNHFNVYAGKGAVRWYVGAWERDVIRPHALGRFADLVRATARHPAMLFYLDNWLSARPDPTIAAGPFRGLKTGLNENYARELMELHTLGVDGGYTQQDVREVARAFTGWSIERPQHAGRFVFRPRLHDPGDKVVLGRRLPGGGEEEGDRVIDLLTRHPATARFIAAKLTRRFVGDDPPPALVDRVASVYLRSGGDIRQMLRAIIASPAFLDPRARGAKIKKPFEFVVSAVRALAGTVTIEGGFSLARASAKIGEALYGCEAPTGYPDRAEAWVNPGALLARLNFGLSLAQGRLPGVTIDSAALAFGADRRRPDSVLDRLLGTVLGGRVSAETRAVLAGRLTDPQTAGRALDRELLALVIGAPEFQRR